jgi:hypothetical protein
MYPNKGWASTQPYEYSDYNSSDEQSPTFDSYTIPEDDLELGQSRLLEVDNPPSVFEGSEILYNRDHQPETLPFATLCYYSSVTTNTT